MSRKEIRLGDKKFIFALLGLLIIYVWYELKKPQPEDWTITYHHESTEPFGAKAFQELMDPMFDDTIEHEFKTLFELIKEDSVDQNMFILANGIGLSKEETELLLEQVASGRTIFLSAFGYGGKLADTFDLKSEFQDVLGIMPAEEIEKALGGESKRTITLEWGMEKKEFTYPALGATNFFEEIDEDQLEVLATNDEGFPVLIKYENRGQLIMSTMPLSFTNYFSLLEETSAFTEAQLKLIPQDEPILRNQYYHLGRLESSSPLRVLLANASLRWATFILLIGILLFFVFQSKRQQRIIPIVTPLANLTLEFVRTLGRLYYRQSDHANLSKKRVLYWKEFVRTHYNLNTEHLNDDLKDELERKSGKEKTTIDTLVNFVKAIENEQAISDESLLLFEKKLNEFYGIE